MKRTATSRRFRGVAWATVIAAPPSLVLVLAVSVTVIRSVPAAGSDRQMQYYRDSAHYRIGTGDMILRRLLSPAEARSTLPDDFGMVLTPENIENRLKDDRRRAEVARKFPLHGSRSRRRCDSFVGGSGLGG